MIAGDRDERLPKLTFEQAYLDEGVVLVAGLDEAGRGAWAGPVTAGAAILHLEHHDLLAELDGVKDSKLCTPLMRDRLFDLVTSEALAYGVGHASAAEIDQMGISAATRAAMMRALAALNQQPDALLIDGRYTRLPQTPLPQKCLVRGEQQSISIAAASIVAKVSRDRLMVELAAQYPEYGFARHKGYGTAQHRRALQTHGPCPEHRHSFRPIRNRLIITEEKGAADDSGTGS